MLLAGLTTSEQSHQSSWFLCCLTQGLTCTLPTLPSCLLLLQILLYPSEYNVLTHFPPQIMLFPSFLDCLGWAFVHFKARYPSKASIRRRYMSTWYVIVLLALCWSFFHASRPFPPTYLIFSSFFLYHALTGVTVAILPRFSLRTSQNTIIRS